MRVPIIPSWCKNLPDTTILFSCDILEFFKYSDRTSVSSRDVNNLIKYGSIPSPAIRVIKIDNLNFKAKRSSTFTRKHQWSLGDIRQLRKDMLNENS